MSGLKYTPERAQQAAAQRAQAAEMVYKYKSSRRNKETIVVVLILLVFFTLLALELTRDIVLPRVYEVKYKEEKAAMMNVACEYVHEFSYDSLTGFKLTKPDTIEVNQTKYTFNPHVDVAMPEKSDDIKDGVDYKKVTIKIDNVFMFWHMREIYAAVPNGDGTFTLEPFKDFKQRMHK